jgi:hypothetical protein
VYIGSVASRAARSAPRAVPSTTLPSALATIAAMLPEDEPAPWTSTVRVASSPAARSCA